MHRPIRVRCSLATSAVVLLLLGGALAACGGDAVSSYGDCTPPAGGRCAADVAWPGLIYSSHGGRVLEGVILCGGTLHAIETRGRVTIRLHAGAVGPGAMSCARVEVGIRLAAPVGHRQVLDAVTGRPVRVVGGRPPGTFRPPVPSTLPG
jgi:hypothetical protein